MHVEVARGVRLQPHLASRGVDEHIVGAAGNLQVALRLQFRGGLVVNDLIGAQNVAAVVDHHRAGERPGIALAALALGLPFDRSAAGGRWLRFGHGQNLLAGIVGQGRGNFSGGTAWGEVARSGRIGLTGLLHHRWCSINQRLPPN